MPTYKTGDLFAIPLGDGTYSIGRIMLDVAKQCWKPKLIEDTSPLHAFSNSLLVEIYKTTYDHPVGEQSDLLIPGYFVSPQLVKDGTWPIVEHVPVDPTQVAFPEFVSPFGMNMYLMRGEVRLLLGPGIDGWQGISVPLKVKPPIVLPNICRYYLGRHEGIAPAALANAKLTNQDLRFNDRRSEVYQALGLSEDEPYYPFAASRGFDLARFY
ncbi:hypothetical protein F8S13_23295 [Chloroflexia bacterium SDU3-3]|nr:hypothetical protein F8S13_23295 [Chloroflexia bacterium SDU3-3]